MALTRIHIGKSRAISELQKQLTSRITATFVETLGSDKEKVWVVVHKVPRSEGAIGGKPLAETEL